MAQRKEIFFMPIDCAKFLIDTNVAKIVRNNIEPFIYQDILLIPHFTKAGALKCFQGELRNLRIYFFPISNKLRITNSLHKYAHGCNYTDFKLSEFKNTIEELSDFFHENLFEGDVKSFEIGCNIIVPDANASWKRLASYKANPFKAIVSYGLPYGASCFHKQYTSKIYNKSVETKKTKQEIGAFPLPENIIRWEVIYRRLAALHNRKTPIPIYKVRDLIDIEKMQYLCDDVVSKYNDSIKVCSPNLNGLSLKQITALGRIGNADISSIMKENHPDTYKCDRNIYNKIIKQAQMDAENDGKLIQKKMCELLNS